MTDVDSVLDNATQWATEGVTKPTIKLGQVYSIDLMSRGIVVKEINFADDLVGVVDRNRYSIDSHDIWSCAIVSMTSFTDLKNILGTIKRILAEYTVTATENHFEWQGGDYKIFNNVRFECYFAIIKKKSMIAEF